jgi:quinol monooxygenase YgiN
MATPTDTNRNLLTVIARMRAKAGKEQELREALEALIEPTSQEKGYVNYDLHQGVEDPRWFFFYENWDSAADLDAHLQTPHLVEFAGRLDEFIDESGPLVIERLRRIA